jgi:hypothetical protein
MIDGQSVSPSRCRAPSGIGYWLTATDLSMYDALSNKRTGLSFVIVRRISYLYICYIL